ncbi:MAG: hypothetical protein ABFS56_25505 [Pseudomonadota bacterium]
MKHTKKAVLATAISLCLSGGAAMADSWTVIQGFTSTGGTTMTQTDATANAAQTLSSISLDAGTVTNGTQTVTEGGDLTLTQGGTATADAIQAANNISAATVTDATQTATVTGATALTQEGATATSVQAINRINATTIVKARQTATLNATSGNAMTQSVEGDSNVQALNQVSGATDVDDLIQTAESVTATMNQTASGSSNTQAFNNLSAANVGATTTVEQTVSADDGITLNQNGSGANNTQALNNASVSTNLAGLTQTATTDDATLNQGADASGGNNVQAINNVDVDNAVTGVNGLTQTVSPNDAATLSLLQSANTGAGDQQALNRLNMSNSATSVGADVSQTVGSSGTTADLDFDQTNTTVDGLIQAGNLIVGVNNMADGVTQTIDINSVNFKQTNTEAVLQTGNGVVLGSLGTGTGTITQTTNSTGGVALIQETVAASLQSVNYVGVAP